MHLRFFIYFSISTLFYSNTIYAQLNKVFEDVFNKILIEKLTLSPGAHANHFIPAAENANKNLTPALNSLIASNVSSFPLSSTIAGITFDFSTGQPVSVTESLGPIFAETAETLGKGKVNVGFNFTYLDLAKFRGLATEEMKFTFTHQDVTSPFGNTLGDSPNESDLIELTLGMDVSASIFAMFATMGITNNFDIGVAIPFININLRGEATAEIISHTFTINDTANHRFNTDGADPILIIGVPYDESTTGLGDITIRMKYSFLRGTGVDMAALVDLRPIPGDEENFMSTGNPNLRFSWIMSKKIGSFTPHLNMGYDRRWDSHDSDEFEFILGFDQKLTKGITFAAGILAEYDLEKKEKINKDSVVNLPLASLIEYCYYLTQYLMKKRFRNIYEIEYDFDAYMLDYYFLWNLETQVIPFLKKEIKSIERDEVAINKYYQYLVNFAKRKDYTFSLQNKNLRELVNL